jgi:hypothetical protein
MEIVGEMGYTFRQLAVERGAAETFAWMESSLSNVVFVEGPFSVTVRGRPEDTLSEVYARHVTPPLRRPT